MGESLKNESEIQFWKNIKDLDSKNIGKESLRVLWNEIIKDTGVQLTALKKEHALGQVKKLETKLSKGWAFDTLNENEKTKVTFLIQLLFEDTPYDCWVVDGDWWGNTQKWFDAFLKANGLEKWTKLTQEIVNKIIVFSDEKVVSIQEEEKESPLEDEIIGMYYRLEKYQNGSDLTINQDTLDDLSKAEILLKNAREKGVDMRIYGKLAKEVHQYRNKHKVIKNIDSLAEKIKKLSWVKDAKKIMKETESKIDKAWLHLDINASNAFQKLAGAIRESWITYVIGNIDRLIKKIDNASWKIDNPEKVREIVDNIVAESSLELEMAWIKSNLNWIWGDLGDDDVVKQAMEGLNRTIEKSQQKNTRKKFYIK